MQQTPRKRNKTLGATGLGSLLEKYTVEEKPAYITQEFQDFGYRLAVELGDLEHKSLYMRMAKKEPRVLLERALSYISDAKAVKSKAKLFMWRLKQLKAEKTAKEAAKSGAEATQPSASPGEQIELL